MARGNTKPDTVARCVPRQDGGYLVQTLGGLAGSSPFMIPEGTRVVIRDGVAHLAAAGGIA